MILELKADVGELKEAFADLESRVHARFTRLEATLAALSADAKALHEDMGLGLRRVGGAIEKFKHHVDVHADQVSELTAKVNDHDDRIAALEAKVR